MQGNWNSCFPTHSHIPLIFAPSVSRGIAAQRTRLLTRFIHPGLHSIGNSYTRPCVPFGRQRPCEFPKRAKGLPNFPRMGHYLQSEQSALWPCHTRKVHTCEQSRSPAHRTRYWSITQSSKSQVQRHIAHGLGRAN